MPRKAPARCADIATFVSEAEARLFGKMTGLANIRAVSNGIDGRFFDPESDFPRLAKNGPGTTLLFTGQMDYAPNVDAVCWFARQVMPKLSGAKFVIAGRNPTEKVRKLAGPAIQVTGAVDDIRSWLAAADMIVAPLRIARGIQNKVLEAMAMAKPVIASPAAFEGIEAVAGRDLLVADGADEMAAGISRIQARPDAGRVLGDAARRLVTTSYGWEQRLAALDPILLAGSNRIAA